MAGHVLLAGDSGVFGTSLEKADCNAQFCFLNTRMASDSQLLILQANGDQPAFWSFADSYIEPTNLNESACWSAINHSAKQSLSPGLAQVLQQAIGSRQLTAKVAMLQSLADTQLPEVHLCTNS